MRVLFLVFGIPAGAWSAASGGLILAQGPEGPVFSHASYALRDAFEPGTAILSPAGEAGLAPLLGYLTSHPQVTASFHGFIDYDASEDLSEALLAGRRKALRAWLLLHGARPRQLSGAQDAQVVGLIRRRDGAALPVSGAFQAGGLGLSQDGRRALDAAARMLAAAPSPGAEIQGFADDSGSPALEREMMLRRQAVVRDYLVARGLVGKTLVLAGAGGLGEESPEGPALWGLKLGLAWPEFRIRAPITGALDGELKLASDGPVQVYSARLYQGLWSQGPVEFFAGLDGGLVEFQGVEGLSGGGWQAEPFAGLQVSLSRRWGVSVEGGLAFDQLGAQGQTTSVQDWVLNTCLYFTVL